MASSPTTSLKLEAGLKERLHRLATARRRSSHWLMREAIEQYVEREEARERLKRMRWPHGQTLSALAGTSQPPKLMHGSSVSKQARTRSRPCRTRNSCRN